MRLQCQSNPRPRNRRRPGEESWLEIRSTTVRASSIAGGIRKSKGNDVCATWLKLATNRGVNVWDDYARDIQMTRSGPMYSRPLLSQSSAPSPRTRDDGFIV